MKKSNFKYMLWDFMGGDEDAVDEVLELLDRENIAPGGKDPILLRTTHGWEPEDENK